MPQNFRRRLWMRACHAVMCHAAWLYGHVCCYSPVCVTPSKSADHTLTSLPHEQPGATRVSPQRATDAVYLRPRCSRRPRCPARGCVYGCVYRCFPRCFPRCFHGCSGRCSSGWRHRCLYSSPPQEEAQCRRPQTRSATTVRGLSAPREQRKCAHGPRDAQCRQRCALCGCRDCFCGC